MTYRILYIFSFHIYATSIDSNKETSKKILLLIHSRTGNTVSAVILNEASKVAVEVLGETKGIATRAAFGVSSLPLNSPVEIQAIIEIE